MRFLKNTDNILVCIYLGALQPTYGLSRIPILALNLIMWFITVLVAIWVIDAFTATSHTQLMQVSGKYSTPEYTTVTYINNSPIITYYPEDFTLQFAKVYCSVSEDFYTTVTSGQALKVSYYTGITGNSYCTKVNYAN